MEELAKFRDWNVKEAEHVSITFIGLDPLKKFSVIRRDVWDTIGFTNDLIINWEICWVRLTLMLGAVWLIVKLPTETLADEGTE